jgi:hypothetical protein
MRRYIVLMVSLTLLASGFLAAHSAEESLAQRNIRYIPIGEAEAAAVRGDKLELLRFADAYLLGMEIALSQISLQQMPNSSAALEKRIACLDVLNADTVVTKALAMGKDPRQQSSVPGARLVNFFQAVSLAVEEFCPFGNRAK